MTLQPSLSPRLAVALIGGGALMRDVKRWRW